MAGDEGLDDSAEAHLDALLVVEPYRGWGWNDREVRPADVPKPFHARLIRLWAYAGLRRGGIARIEEAGHLLDGCVLTFATHGQGRYNFTDRLGGYYAAITDSEPSADGVEWPLKERGADVRLNGWVKVSAASA